MNQPGRTEATTIIHAEEGSIIIAGDIGSLRIVSGASRMHEYEKQTSSRSIPQKDINQLKSRYKSRYEKHSINTVDKNKRITPKETNIKDFAVNLKISHDKVLKDEFRDEMRRHLKNLKRFTGDDIEISQLIDNDNRVSFIRGIAGMGKTVLAKQLVVGWANESMYENFPLCIMFECRDLNEYFLRTKGVEPKKDEAFDNFLKSIFNFDLGDGEGVLFVVDGLDELYDLNTNQSIIGKLLNFHFSKYTRSKIIITGRPHVEYKLLEHGNGMGGLKTFEIQGLSHDQIDGYITKFFSLQKDILTISKAKNLSKRNLPILHVPQFLNTFCCVSILMEGEAINNASELYSWTIYLLLKQHGDPESYFSRANCSSTFKTYSNQLIALSKVCYMLLKENKIIFEGKIESLVCETDLSRMSFFKGLFEDVSDDLQDKVQFTHLSLMEFLAALHICSNLQDPMEIIKENLDRGSIEVISFTCSLIGGFSSEGIIKELLKNGTEIDETIDQKLFMKNVLDAINRANLVDDIKFKRSVEIISCFLSKEFNDEKCLLQIISQLNFNGSLEFRDSNNLLNICNHLTNVCGCEENAVLTELKNIEVQMFNVNDWNPLKCVKYFNVSRIGLNELETNMNEIMQKLREIEWIGRSKEVWIRRCKLEDVDEMTSRAKIADETIGWLTIFDCKLDANNFKNICELGVLSEVFRLINQDVKSDWWEALVLRIEERTVNKNLKELNADGCTTEMTEKCKMRIMQCGIELWIDRKKVVIPSTSVTETGANSTTGLPVPPSHLTICESAAIRPSQSPENDSDNEGWLNICCGDSNGGIIVTEYMSDIPPHKETSGRHAMGKIGSLFGLSHEIRKILADFLEHNYECLRQLILQCSDVIDAIDRNKILYNVCPSISFFEHLAQERPRLTLEDIRESIETKHGNNPHEHANIAIFKNIEDAIQKKVVTFTLEYTLQELKSNGEHWAYIVNHIACELVEKEQYLLPTWKDVAHFFGFTVEFIRNLETRNMDKERPTFKLLDRLNEKRPDLDIDYLVKRLSDVRRNDIIIKCGWSEMLQK